MLYVGILFSSISDERFDCPLEFPDPQKTGQFSLLGLSTQMGASLHFCDVHQNEIPSLHFQQKMARWGKKNPISLQ